MLLESHSLTLFDIPVAHGRRFMLQQLLHAGIQLRLLRFQLPVIQLAELRLAKLGLWPQRLRGPLRRLLAGLLRLQGPMADGMLPMANAGCGLGLLGAACWAAEVAAAAG